MTKPMIKIETKNFENVAKKLNQFPQGAKKAFTKGLKKAGNIVEADAKRRCRVKTGRLRSSITTEEVSWDEIHVGTNVEYAPHVEFGTGPHTIVPVNKEFLSFVKGGKRIFTKIVHHPGSKAYPFLRPALFKNRAKIKVIITESIKEVLPK
jgi:HK97 gp10 family phage protein